MLVWHCSNSEFIWRSKMEKVALLIVTLIMHSFVVSTSSNIELTSEPLGIPNAKH